MELYFEIPIRRTGVVFKLTAGNLHLIQSDYRDVRYIQDFQDGTKFMASVDKEMVLEKS